jgi:hypothetical protein
MLFYNLLDFRFLDFVVVARMRVPKMVKNGFKSALISRERAACNRRHGHARKPKLSSNLKRRLKTILGQFRNNHARNYRVDIAFRYK